MVEMHGGKVQAYSAWRGKGSEFVVRLPVEQRQEVARPPSEVPPEVALSPGRILIIEDNVDAGEALAVLLRMSGHEVEVALDGPSGLESFEQVHPQFVLCDIGLPGLDGYEVVAKIRKLEHEPRPALIAITGYGDAASVDRALRAGFDRHLVKPVSPDAILRMVQESAHIVDWPSSGQAGITRYGSLDDDDRRECNT